MVRLPHQQPRLDLERDVDGGAVRLRHLDPLERDVHAVVDGRRRARLEEERQVDAGPDEDDERVERYLPEQERPVVRKQVAERLTDQRGRPAALVDEPDDGANQPLGLASFMRTPHHDGPTGPEKVPAARSTPRASTISGSCGRGRPAGPEMTP